jgi:dTDP-D-glucose 4,6-dehydratase
MSHALGDLSAPPGKVYDVGGGCGRTNLEIAELTLNLVDGPRNPISCVPNRRGHGRRYATDSTHLRNPPGRRPYGSGAA